jgi:hypothetical protein
MIDSKGKTRCRHLAKDGAQANSVEGRSSPQKRFGFIMNTFAMAAGKDISLQYQIEHAPTGERTGTVQVQKEENVILARKATSQVSGYRFEIVVERP